jgi:hypothetical protein
MQVVGYLEIVGGRSRSPSQMPYCCIEKQQVIRTNDDLILDCCQYYFQQQLRTYLCTSDVNLRIAAEIAEHDGIVWILSSIAFHK